MRRLRAVKPSADSKGRRVTSIDLQSLERAQSNSVAVSCQEKNFSTPKDGLRRVAVGGDRLSSTKASGASRLLAHFGDGTAHAPVDALDGVNFLPRLIVVGVVLENLSEVCERVLVDSGLPGRPIDFLAL